MLRIPGEALGQVAEGCRTRPGEGFVVGLCGICNSRKFFDIALIFAAAFFDIPVGRWITSLSEVDLFMFIESAWNYKQAE